MGSATRIAVVCGVALLVATAVSAYAWDASKADQVADGIRVGPVEVGGLDEPEARRVLRRELVAPLERPVRVAFRGREFRLAADELDVRADIGGMVSEALAAGREDGLPARVWRYATGGEVERVIEPEVAYSREAIDEFVAEVTAAVNREPVDATIQPAGTTLNSVPSSPGIALRAGKLRNDIAAALGDGGGSRTIAADARRIEPEVTARELVDRYPTYITIDRASFELRFFQNLKLAENYTIAVGQLGYETDPGLYTVQSMQVNPSWNVPESDWAGELAGQVIPGGDPQNPLAARWMGFNGAEGIHGTTDLGSLGTAASHGCIRMSVPDVIELYDRVSVGTPVYVE
jgi:hypothetical protein